jgi:hypothetical protein
MNKRIFDTSAANETINSSNAQGAVFSVGSKMPNGLGYKEGAAFDWGGPFSSPTLLLGLDDPTKEEIMALGSAGKKSFGIVNAGTVQFLLVQYRLNTTPNMELALPYHAGLYGNTDKWFQGELQAVQEILANDHRSRLSLTTIVYDSRTGIIHGLNVTALPRQCSRFLVRNALRQVQAPIDFAEYERFVENTFQACPTWKSLRDRAVCWEGSKA